MDMPSNYWFLKLTLPRFLKKKFTSIVVLIHFVVVLESDVLLTDESLNMLLHICSECILETKSEPLTKL